MKMQNRFVSAQPEQSMIPEVESHLDYKMFSHSGKKIRCSSLRPGMRIKAGNNTWTVVQNSQKHRLIEVSGYVFKPVKAYHELAFDHNYTVYPPSLWYQIKRIFR